MIQRIKAISLVILVISSIILTVVLWYSAPPYDEQTNTYIPASYIGKDNYVPKKDLYQLTTPPFLISHQQGEHQLITSQQATLFAQLTKYIYRVKLDSFELINPSADDWKQLFFQANGIELSFFQDIPVDQLDAFYYHLLENEVLFQSAVDTISRVWIFDNPKTNKQEVWFISDQNGKVIRANTNVSGNKWSKQIQSIKQNPTLPMMEAIPTNGKNPWDRTNQNIPFSRVLYLPSQPIEMAKLTYANPTISVDNMKEWLFQGNQIEPIELSKNESVYMDNNQILTFYKQQSYMVYVDNVYSDETKTTVGNEIDMINSKFMSKHHGWTGNFMLDSMSQQENSRLYTFRLINQGLPVYWQRTTNNVNYLDTIQLQAGTGVNAISKYVRSLNYLAKQPSKKVDAKLPSKATIIQTLSTKKIPLFTVKRILPIYIAKRVAKGEIQLTPCWRVEHSNGEVIQIGGEN